MIELFPELATKICLLSEIGGKGVGIVDPELMSSGEKKIIVNQIREIITNGFSIMLKLVESSSELKQ